jgi:hypothetical protein
MASTKKEAIAAVRGILDDTVGTDSEKYWTDADLNNYYVEAIKLFCRLTRCIKDSMTDAVCLLTLEAGDRNAPLHAAILPNQIEMATPSWTGKLTPATMAELERYQTNWQTDVGVPDQYILDYSDGYLTLNREVTEAATIRLTVRRMPVDPSANIPEIPSMYFECLYDYMLYRAFRKQDSEIYNPEKADAHLVQFRGKDEINPGGHCGRVLKEKSGLLPQRRPVRSF